MRVAGVSAPLPTNFLMNGQRSVPSRKYKAQFSRSVLRTEYAMRFPTTGATGSVLLISSVGRSAHLCHAFEGLDSSGRDDKRSRPFELVQNAELPLQLGYFGFQAAYLLLPLPQQGHLALQLRVGLLGRRFTRRRRSSRRGQRCGRTRRRQHRLCHAKYPRRRSAHSRR